MVTFADIILIAMNRLILWVLGMLGICIGCNARGIESVGPEEFERMIRADTTAVVLDVRTPEEYAVGHLKGAVLLDVKDGPAFEAGAKKLDTAKHYYVYCRSGRRSMNACGILHGLGLQVTDLAGGIMAWERDGLPVMTGK